jgi:superfamily II DNA or RNA helicase
MKPSAETRDMEIQTIGRWLRGDSQRKGTLLEDELEDSKAAQISVD